MPPARDLLARFDDKWERGEGGCWLWTASLTTSGYGQIWITDRLVLANRVAWVLYRGPLAPGEQVLHWCGHKRCVCPLGGDHLYVGDHADNYRDRVRLGEPLLRNRYGAEAISL